MKKSDFNIQVKEIMDNFDFDKVLNIMKKMDWKWMLFRNDDFACDIPTVDEIKETSNRILNELYEKSKNEEIYSISIGGLKATKYEYYVSLDFILESCNTSDFIDDTYIEKMELKKNRNKKIIKIQNSNNIMKKQIEIYEMEKTEILHLLLNSYEKISEVVEIEMEKLKSNNMDYSNLKSKNDNYLIDISLIRMELNKRLWNENKK